MPDRPLKLVGAPGSPYSRKLRAVLRYRRIPFRWIIRNSKHDVDIPPVPVALIPVLVFPGEPDSAMIDTSFQIRRLEELVPTRSVIPPDAGLAFLDALIEDYGDEWLTKAMFHYRWVFDADIRKAASILPRWGRIEAPAKRLERAAQVISERQIGRLPVVGSNATTAQVIEDSYRRFLRAFDAHLAQQPFALGGRPGAADFGLFGQLTQLAQFDPTPMSIALEEAPRVFAWCDVTEDLSGLEVDDADWTPRDAVPDTLRGLVAEIGRVYAPFLLANDAALERGAGQVECEIDGKKWIQKPFAYQGKCLRWLREGYAALEKRDRTFVDGILADTGCEVLFRA
jgi:glutathione S-transferase